MKLRKNTEINKIISAYEERLEDKDKIIELLEKENAKLKKLASIKTTFKEIEWMQNELKEKLEKVKRKKVDKNENNRYKSK